MRIDQYHQQKLAQDPEYAEAVKFVKLAQDFADLVVRLRVRAGISQTELATAAGTTQAVISRLENGEGNPTAELISRVMLALIGVHAPAVEPKASATPLAEVFPEFAHTAWRPLTDAAPAACDLAAAA